MRWTLDSRQVKPGLGFVAVKGEKVDGRDFIPQARAAGAVRVLEGEAALAAAARDYRRTLRAKVVGVTGSAGKTTTKEFLKAFLACPGTEGNLNNHLGLPLTVLNCPEDADFLVVEMGTNHPGEIAALCDVAEPDVGVITSVGTAHLEFFGTRAGIAEEKGTLFARTRDFNVAASDNPELVRLRGKSRARLLEVDPASLPFACPLPGAHNAANMALAYAVARELGVTREDCAARTADFALPGARWRRFEANGVSYIDDSYNANPDSMIAALDAFVREPCDGCRVAVLGDMFELGPQALELHRKVFDHARALGIPLVIGVGEMSSQCICNLAYKTLAPLKRKFRFDVSAGDLVLLKGSHGMRMDELVSA